MTHGILNQVSTFPWDTITVLFIIHLYTIYRLITDIRFMFALHRFIIHHTGIPCIILFTILFIIRVLIMVADLDPTMDMP